MKSDSIASIGYDTSAEILEVEFKRGGVYRYLDVPDVVHQQLRQAESHGKYVNEHIKPHYRATRC